VRRAAFRFRVGVQHAESCGHLIARLPSELQPKNRMLGVPEILRSAPNVAVLTEPCRLGAKEHFVAERHVDHARDVEVVEIAAGDAQVSFALRVRLSAEHADRAAGAVSAEQRALRAAKHLDTFHVENAHHRPRGPGHEDVVDVEPYAALSGCTSSAAY